MNFARKHIFEDINPYTCLLEDCSTPFATYATERDWEKHVKDKHPPRRLCPFCQDSSTIFLSMEALLEDVQVEHAEAASESLMMAVMSHLSVVTIGVPNCPLCDSTGPESDPEFIKHVLQCMHDFSLRSLPWAGRSSDKSRCVRTYNLELAEYEGISRWLADLKPEETSKLQLSEYDNFEVSPENHLNVHFENNAYFDLESAQDSIEALERSSKSFSQQEADLDSTEETKNFHLPFPTPSYLRESSYMSRLNAAYRGMTRDRIDQIDDQDLLPLPSRWNDDDKGEGLELTDEGLEVKYTGLISKHDHEASAVRADKPMSPQCAIYYFEVRIISVDSGGSFCLLSCHFDSYYSRKMIPRCELIY
ncbi:uncharacterized protein N7483_009514 [Penicillium malachiteum]|uniref:uncharacterized protein n=1 Tax=Penicillium malachiteum TaxID=1324776 RepID=UPI002546E363|nr:uncharacterized protein N7483_009514 [Penicillium malachiteum]KAJ5721580.1 hypothetical protein N7483_009514 [Penicillium malachiteum]